jgi:hypothetical protein
MPQLNSTQVFSLADVLKNVEQIKGARQEQDMRAQQMQAQQMAAQRAQEEGQQQAYLNQIVGNAFVTSPEQTTPNISPEAYSAGQMGPPGPDVVTPGTTEFSFPKAYQMASQLPPGAAKAQALLALQKQQQDQEDRRLKMQIELSKARGESGGRGISDNDLYTVASGGVSGNPNADRLGREGAINALRQKPPIMFPEGSFAMQRGGQPPGGYVNPKQIPADVEKRVTSAVSNLEDFEHITKLFKPGLGGHQVSGDYEKDIQSIFKGDLQATDFWQSMQRIDNKQRHELFGGALTPTEFSEWRRSTIHPRMRDDVIAQNLRTREAIARKAATRLVSGYNTPQYDTQQLSRFAGGRQDLLSPEQNAPLQPQQKKTIKWGDL